MAIKTKFTYFFGLILPLYYIRIYNDATVIANNY